MDLLVVFDRQFVMKSIGMRPARMNGLRQLKEISSVDKTTNLSALVRR